MTYSPGNRQENFKSGEIIHGSFKARRPNVQVIKRNHNGNEDRDYGPDDPGGCSFPAVMGCSVFALLCILGFAALIGLVVYVFRLFAGF